MIKKKSPAPIREAKFFLFTRETAALTVPTAVAFFFSDGAPLAAKTNSYNAHGTLKAGSPRRVKYSVPIGLPARLPRSRIYSIFDRAVTLRLRSIAGFVPFSHGTTDPSGDFRHISAIVIE